MKLIIIFLVLLSSCSGIDPAASPYVIQFMQDYKQYKGEEIKILPEITIEPEEVVYSGEEHHQIYVDAECQPSSNQYSSGKIVLGQFEWERLTDEQKKWLVYHELGHCILKRNHKNDKDTNGNPVSIMNQFFISEDKEIQYYSENNDAYNKELFK